MSYLSQSEAYAILKLPLGAGREAVMASYKKLAQQWFPEKHQHSNESLNQFSNISKAYSRLCSDVDRVDMDMEAMYKLFNKIVHPKSQKNKNSNFEELNSTNDTSCRRDVPFTNKSLKSDKFEKSANHQESNNHGEVCPDNARRKKCSEINSSQQARQSSIPNDLLGQQHLLHQQVLTSNCEEPISKNEDVIVKSRQFAIEGNALANQGLYSEAVAQFTKAIELDSSDFRFYGNRSFCFERQGSYAEALADAEEAIKMAPEWPKGYFRKGKALTGSKNFAEAEEAYLQVLKLDSKCPDAKLELTEVRVQRLMEMGFKKQQAAEGIRRCETVEAALESILNNQVPEGNIQDVVASSEDEEAAKGTNSTSASSTNSSSKIEANTGKQQSKKQKQQKAPLPPIPQHHYEQAQRQILLNKQQDVVKMNPRNPEGLTSLWVGNVLPEAKQETLVKLFSKYGQLQSVKCIPEKFCAFINFANKDCAGRAMENLQGADLFGQKLLIKFPDHPVNPANGEKIPTKNSTKSSQQSRNNALSSLQSSKQAHPGTTNHNSVSASSSSMAANTIGGIAGQSNAGCLNSSSNPRTTGPVNGDECYFWRTTGCQFTGTCRYKHIPDHKGIDRKPWHKSK